ncbi:hypothetical protein NLK61_28305 [Pseudomonas fuscovaginae UPB0736]|uniref:DUF7079 family protein n=1 Tax=Pseudomonas asplenii TaxID=53407 RepID=UPI0002882BDD|nr:MULTISPECIES: hypothetical protein [Pseudomonas]UUQ65042.1 hypothetical protein NLK61_28305 [Pseudomonas fuscovaginae UPB0736]UZE31724.1 hypothetical protein LOY63_13705 [Pseudomonas asplenii]
MKHVDNRRLKLWQALSSLFLDTEIDDGTYDYIARTILETGYSPEEVHRILWGEVFPVLEANLRSVAGEWACWSDEWLLTNLRVNDEPQVKNHNGAVAREIERCWVCVANRLQGQ